ncbi:transglycosylase domain-containing protein [Bradyrhizobium sp. CIAT3101]|uniref:transglycosylase domain-containing protein n=1 Tax=Bradyrhizobium sp. CIAT3101 TaxID=439387 RepID=UPI0024B1D71D|nr:transglycosylase domain-containing protein [Bradyrhizobium sp. CIAT3101]WFU80439.1 transglycosylase domain-containing protein [Bradyrhizobium sp. CIAT3101]
MKASDVTACLLGQLNDAMVGGGIGRGVPIPLGDFPDALIKAALATEDRHFYDHVGIDIPRALRVLLLGGQNGVRDQDGSSISQQLARTFLLNAGRGIGHPIKQALLAVWLEWNLTKDEILKLYLNCVDMGGGILGVDGASRFYFNKPARDITFAEAATLVGLINAPTAHIDRTAAQARANAVLDNLVEAGFMTEDQVLEARHNAARVVLRGKETRPN